MRTSYNNNLSFNSWSIRIGRNFFEDGDVFEAALVRKGSYQLFAEGSKTPFRRRCHGSMVDDGYLVVNKYNKQNQNNLI